MMSLAQTVKYLKNTVTNCTKLVNDKILEKYATAEIIGYINGTEGGAKSIRNIIKERTFKNLPPKIGYFNETIVKLTCSSGTMTCRLQETPVFLGGYFSVVPAKDISLKPNSTNYIYFHRNSDDYKVVDVEVTQSPRNDVDGFNRIYLAKVVTNANGPVSQEYNQIDNYHKKK